MIDIIILNNNPVISKLIALGLDSNEISFVEINTDSSIPKQSFDILFVDEHYDVAPLIQERIDQIEAKHKILLNSSDEIKLKKIDQIIKKPFLPKDLYEIAKSIQANNAKIEQIKNKDAKESTESREKHSDENQTSILDYSEIETIKELLDDDIFETSEEKREKEKKSKKKREKKRKDDISIENHQELEEKILLSLSSMKTKKIRKLLEGTEVSISIKFPKGE